MSGRIIGLRALSECGDIMNGEGGGASEWRNKQTNERTNKRTNERMNE